MNPVLSIVKTKYHENETWVHWNLDQCPWMIGSNSIFHYQALYPDDMEQFKGRYIKVKWSEFETNQEALAALMNDWSERMLPFKHTVSVN